LEYVESQNGRWVPGAEAFEAAIQTHPRLQWVRYIREKPGAKIAITGVVEKLRRDQFAVEKKKSGPYRNSRVFFRGKAPARQT